MNHSFDALLKVHSIIPRFFLYSDYVAYRVEKCMSHGLHFNLLSTSLEFFIDQNQFYLKFYTPSHSI